MRLKLILTITLSTLILLSFFSFLPDNDWLKFVSQSNYASQWSDIEKDLDKDLTSTALEKVNTLYKQAQKDNNHPQIIKSLIYKGNLESRIKEDIFSQTLITLQNEADTAHFPLDAFLHSMLAELYFNYYNNNKWTIDQRTHVNDTKSADLKTWTQKNFYHTVLDHVNKSLKAKDSLQKVPIAYFSDILTQDGKSNNVRPSLFDFLAHRKIQFLSGYAFDNLQITNDIELNNKKLLMDKAQFANIDLDAYNKMAPYVNIVETYHKLYDRHSTSNNKDALLDLEINRLNFFAGKTKLPESQRLFLDQLIVLQESYKSLERSTLVLHNIAQQYHNRSYYHQVSEEKSSKEILESNSQALKYCEIAMDRFPKSIGALKCKAMAQDIQKPSLSFITEEVTVPNEPGLAQISISNSNKVHVKIIELNPEEFKKRTYRLPQKEILEYLLKQKNVYSKSIPVEASKDYLLHKGEIEIPALPLGYYALILSLNEQFLGTENITGYSPFWVSNIAYTAIEDKGFNDKLKFLHRKTGEPLKGVEVELYSTKYNYKTKQEEETIEGKYTTNEQGEIMVNKATYDYKSSLVRAKYNNDYLNSGSIYFSKDHNTDYNNIHTHLFTDRSIYRPGQNIYFKGIVTKTENQLDPVIQKQYKTTIELLDVNYKKVQELEVTTNDFGSFSGSFVLPKGLLNGYFQIVDVKNRSKIYVSVEEYKRPNFEVNTNPLSGEFSVNQSVKLKGNAKTYSGVGLESAKVSFRVMRNTYFTHHYSYRWPHAQNEVEIANGVMETDATGTFNIPFTLKPDESIPEKDQPVFYYTVHIDVTDINGETHSTSTYVVAGYHSLKLTSSISDIIKKSEHTRLEIRTTNLSGEPLHTNVSLTIKRLKSPNTVYKNRLWPNSNDLTLIEEQSFKESFPRFEWNNENDPINWKVLETIMDKSIHTSTDSNVILNTNKWKSGKYVLEASAKDKNGKEVTLTKYFTVFDISDQKVPTNDFLWTESSQNSYEPGETAQIQVGTKLDQLHLFYVLENEEGATIQKELKLSDNTTNIEIPILEKHRGNLFLHFYGIYDNRPISKTVTLVVPYSNKQLDIRLETFRNHLTPGNKEEWKLTVKGPRAEKVNSEVLASMYDASLDAFKDHSWYFSNFTHRYPKLNVQFKTFEFENSANFSSLSRIAYPQNGQIYYDRLNWFTSDLLSPHYPQTHYKAYSVAGEVDKEKAVYDAYGLPIEEDMNRANVLTTLKDLNSDEDEASKEGKGRNNSPHTNKLRTNFNETAFFYPQLNTNENGETVISFTTPDALTKWKFMALAHTQELASSIFQKEIEAKKKLMVTPNFPRFFRQGDQVNIKVKISNLSNEKQEGSQTLIMVNNLSNDANIRPLTKPFSIEPGSSTVIEWKMDIPENVTYLRCKTQAQSKDFSDGEERIIPVLPNRKLVTEALPLTIRGNTSKTFSLNKLKRNDSKTLKHYNLTLEYTSNPIWYVVQALPYMKEQGNENCSEHIFTRWYANQISAHIAQSNPKIKKVIDYWSKYDESALLSQLQKNEELKEVILQETPWVLEAESEEEQKKRIGLLFDLDTRAAESDMLYQKLEDLQLSNGAWPWMKGMNESRYITQHIIGAMGKLKQIGMIEAQMNNHTIEDALFYLDAELYEDYVKLKKDPTYMKDYSLNSTQLHYFYVRSYFRKVEIAPNHKEAYNYYFKKLKTDWTKRSSYEKGLMALSLHRLDEQKIAEEIVRSLKENAVYNDELGMYWKDNVSGYYWSQAKIETQAMLIEAFKEVTGDAKSVNEMIIWLIKNKQTNNWKTSKATAEACYAILLNSTTLIEKDNSVTIEVGNKKLDLNKEMDLQVGTGYIKKSWSENEITVDMATVKVENKGESINWGGLYWQYFEDLDNISQAGNNLNLTKELYLEKNSDEGPILQKISIDDPIKVGDKIIVRIILNSDRDMEYVHMKDMRASGFEPIHVLSGYRWRNGLGYYETTKDVATHFYFDYLPKGTYVFEYPLRANIAGSFSNGTSTIQCMYAPEFVSHSKGISVTIE